MHTTLFCCTIYIVLVCLTCMSSLLLFATEYTLEPYEKFDVKRNKTVIYRQSKLDLNVPFDTSVSDGHHLFVFLFEILNIYARTMSFLRKYIVFCWKTSLPIYLFLSESLTNQVDVIIRYRLFYTFSMWNCLIFPMQWVFKRLPINLLLWSLCVFYFWCLLWVVIF